MRDAIVATLCCVVFALLFAWLIINWLMGCGEAFPTADGSYIYGECWLHPWEAPND